ncbi:hypothetical protein DVH05_008317 [Phytophthora capsici]|nr:hypothetical protein DVH05_008317 [Phytophthora capsici]
MNQRRLQHVDDPEHQLALHQLPLLLQDKVEVGDWREVESTGKNEQQHQERSQLQGAISQHVLDGGLEFDCGQVLEVQKEDAIGQMVHCNHVDDYTRVHVSTDDYSTTFTYHTQAARRLQ